MKNHIKYGLIIFLITNSTAFGSELDQIRHQIDLTKHQIELSKHEAILKDMTDEEAFDFELEQSTKQERLEIEKLKVKINLLEPQKKLAELTNAAN